MAAILDLYGLQTTIKHSVMLPVCRNLYIDAKSMSLCWILMKLWLLCISGVHFGSHLGFLSMLRLNKTFHHICWVFKLIYRPKKYVSILIIVGYSSFSELHETRISDESTRLHLLGSILINLPEWAKSRQWIWSIRERIRLVLTCSKPAECSHEYSRIGSRQFLFGPDSGGSREKSDAFGKAFWTFLVYSSHSESMARIT